MCGIVATIGASPSAFDRAVDAVRHRGVRTSVEKIRDTLIAHARLPIVGVGPEHDQPVTRGHHTVAFVGQILDFRERHPGMECDAELVADTWNDLGPGGFADFDGFWSVVSVDDRDGSIHALVDYLAQKPLYYRRDVPSVASEPAALLPFGPVTPDEVYFSSVVKWGYCPEGRRTPYNEVRKLMPGGYLYLSEDADEEICVDPMLPADATGDELRWEIEAAVKRRVTSSDVPVAALVSGGLDSAIMYTLAKRYGDVRAFHAENDESAEAMVVAPVFTKVWSDDVSIDNALDYMQEPLDLGSLFPQVVLSDAIGRRGVNVCLTGDGADEFFGGYGRAMRYDSQWSDVFHELVNYHLPRLDRVMMRNRVEVRSPFLARRVSRIALGLPYAARRDKKVLRNLFRSSLPAGVADRAKKPLRTATVAGNQEANSIMLVDEFRRRMWPGS